MKEIFKCLFLLLFLFIILLSCGYKIKNDQKFIVTTVFPIYDWTKEIVGDNFKVILLTPPGVEPHSYEPTPDDIIKINESVLFIYVGESMEPWASKIINNLKNTNLNRISIEENIEFLKIPINHNHEHHNHEHNEYEGKNKNIKIFKDPHFWLDFEKDIEVIKLIYVMVSKLDPKNKDFYYNNFTNYTQKLKELDYKYKQTIEKCSIKTLLYGGHFAFNYFIKRYGLKYISAYESLVPEAEPIPGNIIKIIDTIKKQNIDTLYVEELLEPKLARTIQEKTGVKILVLNGAHNLSKEEFDKNLRFLDIMEQNLEKIKIGLKYKE